MIEARLGTASRMNELHNNSRPISPDTNNKTTDVIIDHGFSRPTSAVPTNNFINTNSIKTNTNNIKTNTITIIPSKLLTSTANNVINNTTSTLTVSNLRSHKVLLLPLLLLLLLLLTLIPVLLLTLTVGYYACQG
jgi:hypothetical protein